MDEEYKELLKKQNEALKNIKDMLWWIAAWLFLIAFSL